MDTSETYIKMCEKAEKIQAQWSISEGDWFIDTVTFPNQRILTIVGGCPSFDDYERRHFKECQRRSFWLPRQDQLQEIYKSFMDENTLNDEYAPLSAIEIVEKFNSWLETFTKKKPYSWFNDPTDIRGWVQPSMEQLWLAFVQKENHGKVWNGEDWVKA